MCMIDSKLIEKKLRRIEEFLKEMESVSIASITEFKRNIIVKRFIERDIELAIQEMVDICKHLVAALNLSEPETYSHCFELLADNRIIKNENLPIYISMIRYRNRLIHAYEGVDDEHTFNIYLKRLPDFRIFISEMREYLLKLKQG